MSIDLPGNSRPPRQVVGSVTEMVDAFSDDARLPYLQILEDLRTSIARGDIPPGEKLPSNAELKRRYGVASQTAQNAINALKSEGLVYGVAGRGVFVRTDIDFALIAPSEKHAENQMAQVLQALAKLTKRVDDLERQIDRKSTGPDENPEKENQR